MMNRRFLITLLAATFLRAGSLEAQVVPPSEIQAHVDAAQKPWTSLDMNNDPAQFQFAIVSDNAGGPRQGIFAEAVRKLNLLQPEFVIGVGDFIEGYEDIREDIELQWDRFMEDLEPLEMPFFFLPGNHDNGRPLWADVYRSRFGVEYYHFVYKNVLFLCLSTNDGPENGTGIGEAQIEYFRKVIADHPDVRWTLVFQHKPLWNDKDAKGWPEIEAILKGRKCSVFAGHTHHYLSQMRDGISFVTLATTGGGSTLRGPEYGQFDQVAWVTLMPDGPRVANLLLDGVLDRDFRTEKEARDFALFQTERAVVPTPIHVDGAEFSEGVSRLTITNPIDKPLRLKVLFEVPSGLRVEPGSLHEVIPGSASKEIELRVVAGEPQPLAKVQPVLMHWEGCYDHGNNTPSTRFAGQTRIVIEGRHSIPVFAETPTVDGDLSEWAEMPFTVDQPAEIYVNPTAWKGPQDGRFSFAVGRDDSFLYIAVQAVDDEPQFEGWKYWEDFTLVSIDARPSAQGDPRTTIFGFATGPEMTPEQAAPYEFGKAPEGVQRASRKTSNGFEAELAVPLSYLKEHQGGDWSRVRLNVAVSDFDTRDERDGVTILFWRPQWTGRWNDPESGVFLRELGTN